MIRPLVAALLAASALLVPGPALAQSAPPSSPPVDRYCPGPLVTYPGGGIGQGQEAQIGVRRDVGGRSATYTVSLTRIAPEPVAEVRTATTSSGAAFTVRLGETHTFGVVSYDGQPCVFGNGSTTFTIPVRPTLSIAARRNAARDYTFSGRVLPGRGQAVGLHRVEADGRRILTSRTVVSPDGTYEVRRVFTGSGRFGFAVQVGDSATNLAGSSPVRPTVIH